jgi:hypothetical protein
MKYAFTACRLRHGTIPSSANPRLNPRLLTRRFGNLSPTTCPCSSTLVCRSPRFCRLAPSTMLQSRVGIYPPDSQCDWHGTLPHQETLGHSMSVLFGMNIYCAVCWISGRDSSFTNERRWIDVNSWYVLFILCFLIMPHLFLDPCDPRLCRGIPDGPSSSSYRRCSYDSDSGINFSIGLETCRNAI